MTPLSEGMTIGLGVGAGAETRFEGRGLLVAVKAEVEGSGYCDGGNLIIMISS